MPLLLQRPSELIDGSPAKRKTVVRTMRLSESLIRELQRQADSEGTTVNALTNSILSEYYDWAKKARDFGFIPIYRRVLMRMLERLDDETLRSIGREGLASSWKEMAEFWFQDSSPKALLEAIPLASRFDSNIGTGIKHEEGKLTLVFGHDLGPRWSIVLESALEELSRKTFHTEPKISVGESVVTAVIKLPDKGSPI